MVQLPTDISEGPFFIPPKLYKPSWFLSDHQLAPVWHAGALKPLGLI